MKINRQRLKNLIRNNLELKILAVVVAILVWLYVYHVEIYLPQTRNKATHESRR
ncbi:MAG: hypothetical protein NTY10_04815 [Candidatus Omnitrophica bacterium]|nr:hypothetical protein [Candidatus Omnitrophota bacterium]